MNSQRSDDPSMGNLFKESPELSEFEEFSPQVEKLLRPSPHSFNLGGEDGIDSSLSKHESQVAESI